MHDRMTGHFYPFTSTLAQGYNCIFLDRVNMGQGSVIKLAWHPSINQVGTTHQPQSPNLAYQWITHQLPNISLPADFCFLL